MRYLNRSALAIVLTLTVILAACGDGDDGNTAPANDSQQQEDAGDVDFAPGTLESGATLTTYDQGIVQVHTYTNDEAAFGNSTAVIETDNAVVLVDAHFSEAAAAEFRAYAESFGKPIDRLLITHAHSDHIGGLESVFDDVASYSSAGVVAAAATEGVTITNTLEAGEIEIDGVTFAFDIYTDAEAEEQVVIRIPDAGVVAAGDLVYNDYHAVLSTSLDSWIAAVEQLKSESGVELVVPGHGAPGGPEAFDDIIDYLETARKVYAETEDQDTFTEAMIDAYPDRTGRGLLDFGLGRLFPKPDSDAGEDANDDAAAATIDPAVTVTSPGLFPESVALIDGIAYVSSFATGEIVAADLASGQTDTLVASGVDGVVSGWGLGADAGAGSLISCANRNPLGSANQPNAVRSTDVTTGATTGIWDLPDGFYCNSVSVSSDGVIFASDVSPNADIARVDPVAQTVEVWADDPGWENDSGFGLGGLVVDDAGNVWVSTSAGQLFRVPVAADGSAGQPIEQVFVDADGADTAGYGFDGLAITAEGALYGAALTAEGQSVVVKTTSNADETVTPEVVLTGAVGISGVGAQGSQVAAIDGQVLQALTVDGYEASDFDLYLIGE